MQSLAVRTDPNGVAHVEMTRHVMDSLMIGELCEMFETLAEDRRVRAIVISGQGDVFLRGAAFPRVKRTSQTIAEWSVADSCAYARMLWLIESAPKATISCVRGLAAGAGIGLVCACEFVVASEDASFEAAEPDFGDVPAVIRPYLVSAVGKQQAERLALGGSRIDGQQARAIGLVQAVIPRQELDAATDALAAFLGTVPMRGPI